MRAIYYTATSLDGFLATEDHSLDWLFPHDIDQSGPGGYESFITGVGAIVMGANTYVWLQQHGEAEQPGGDPWPYDVPAWVLTHRDLEPFPGKDIRFSSASVAGLLPELEAAAGDRDLWIVGGGGLAAQFAEIGRLDEVQVAIAPVTLGSGAPLLPAHVELRLESTARNRDFITATYVPLVEQSRPAQARA